jgi:oligopeptide/dipeptide ABC transporter ATP-binding protein
MTAPLVQVEGLAKHFGGGGLFGKVPPVRAVDGVSFSIPRGGSLGLVGESGSGKSTVARAILRLQEPTAGQHLFDGQDVFALQGGALRQMRRRMQIVQQNPNAALHPRQTVIEQVRRPLVLQGIGANRAEQDAMAMAILAAVGLRSEHAGRLPHEFSGGQRQRIAIARALVTTPDFLVLDEPTSALDVSVQAQILALLRDLRRARGLTYLFVSHDLGVIRHMCDRVAVMYLGRLVEEGPKAAIFAKPRHPYTQALISVVPVPDPARRDRPRVLPQGEPPSPRNPPTGCRFHTRCPVAVARCRTEDPALRYVTPGHRVACHQAVP